MLPSAHATPIRDPGSGLRADARRARWRRLSPLARDIVVVLAVKALLLGLLWYAFFREPAAPEMKMDPLRVEQKLLGAEPVRESQDALR
jgi:hypothetical protein